MKKYINRNRVTTGTSSEAKKDKLTLSDNEWTSVEVTEGAASVRVSISIGHSEDYGRNKFTVTVDHGLACGQSPTQKEVAFNEAHAFCLKKAEALREEVIRTLFSGGDK